MKAKLTLQWSGLENFEVTERRLEVPKPGDVLVVRVVTVTPVLSPNSYEIEVELSEFTPVHG